MRGATILKATDDKTRALSDHTLLAYSGEAGDTVQFAEFIQANIALYRVRNSHTLSPSAIAHFTRSELARALRSRNPYTVNSLLGGVDVPVTASFTNAEGSEEPTVSVGKPVPELYWIDYLASLVKLPYAAHGYAQYYCLSILDKHHHPDMNLEAGLKLLQMCADELRRRLPVDFKGLSVKVITAKGIEEVELDQSYAVKTA